MSQSKDTTGRETLLKISKAHTPAPSTRWQQGTKLDPAVLTENLLGTVELVAPGRPNTRLPVHKPNQTMTSADIYKDTIILRSLNV